MNAHDETVAAILKPPVNGKRARLRVPVLLVLALAASIGFVLTLFGCSSASSDKPYYSHQPGRMEVNATTH